MTRHLGLQLTGVPSMCIAMLLGLALESLPHFMSHGYSPYQIVWTRYGTHLALMLVLWGPRDPGCLVRTHRPGLHAIRSLTMLGMPAAFVLAVTRHPVNNVLAVFSTEPLQAMLMAVVILGERVAPRWWLAALLAYAGSMGIYRPTPAPGLISLTILSLSMAACFALYQVLTRAMAHEETTTAKLFYTALGVWVPLTVALPWFWRTPAPRDLLVMMAVGVLGYLVLLFIDRALDVAPVGKVATFALVQPVAGLLVAATLSGRRPSGVALAGALAIVVAGLVIVWPGHGLGEA